MKLHDTTLVKVDEMGRHRGAIQRYVDPHFAEGVDVHRRVATATRPTTMGRSAP